MLAAVEDLFAGADYDWRDPLSARAYLAWHERLTEKSSTVANTAGGDLAVRTLTERSTLADATLTLRASDLKPVEGRFEFRSGGVVEIREAPAESPVATAAPPAAAPAPATPVSRAASRTTPAEDASPADELRVLATLHGLRADLGDPVEVSREGARVLVTGAGLEAARRQEIATALSALPRVEVRFRDTEASPRAAPTATASTIAADPARPGRIERRIGGPSAFEKFAGEALGHADEIMSRLHALRRLAGKFPPSVESTLTEPGRVSLLAMRRAHSVELARRSTEMERHLSRVLADSGATPLAETAAIPVEWQAATEALWRDGRETERLLGTALGGGEVNDDQILDRLRKQLARLRANALAYAQLDGR
jgi:hypothetical protein